MRLLLSVIIMLVFSILLGVPTIHHQDSRTDFLNKPIEEARARLDFTAERELLAWRDAMQQWETLSQSAQVKEVNNYINQKIQYASDQEIWGVEDYWATPLELLIKKKGDCEDYAIAKYIMLKGMGVPIAKLRIAYVNLKVSATMEDSHMVMFYYGDMDSPPLVLDNLISSIRPLKERRDLTVVYSFNDDHLWTNLGQTPLSVKTETRHSAWKKMLDKMRSEGFDIPIPAVDVQPL